MKYALLMLAAVSVCGTAALGVPMPTLATFPNPQFGQVPGNIWAQTNGGADLHAYDSRGQTLLVLVGYASSPVGDDYYVEGTVEFDSITELGFIARGNLAIGRTYEASFDPTNGYFNLVKVTAPTPSGFVNLANVNAGVIPALDSDYKIGLSVGTEGPNVRLKGWLYEPDGDLLASFNYLDTGAGGVSPYTGGVVGTWAFPKTTPFVEGTWTGMRVEVPEPTTMGLLGLGALRLMLRRRQ